MVEPLWARTKRRPGALIRRRLRTDIRERERDGGTRRDVLGLYALLLVGLAAAISARPRTAAPSRAQGDVDVRFVIPLLIGIVLVTFGHERLIAHAALVQRPLPAWMAALPFVPVLDLAPLYGHIDVRTSMAAEGLSLVECALMGALVLVSRGRRLGSQLGIAVAVAVAGLLVVTITAHGLLSEDVYAYVADGLLGPQAYHPSSARLDGEFHTLVKLWGDPPLPCAYGPTWLYPATLLMFGVHSLADGVLRFRLAGAASVFAVAVALFRLRVSRPVLLTFLLNPMVWMQYVVDGHNDLWPVALVLFGRLYAHRPLIACIFGGLAGAAKLPFLVVCCLTGADRPRSGERLRIAAGSLGIAVAISAVAGGPAYLHAIEVVRRTYPASSDPQTIALHMLAFVGTAFAVVMALAARRTAWPAAYSFMGFGSSFPWYAVWGLGYATLTDGAEFFLCTLPLTAFLTATTYASTPLWTPLLVSVFFTACAGAYVLVRTRFFDAPPRSGRAITPAAPFPDASCTRPT